jgi:hypothetical protein
VRLRNSILATCLAGLFILSACSDDGGSQESDDETTDAPSDGVAVDEWVAEVCTSLDEWIGALEAADEELQDVLDLSGTTGRTGDGGLDTGTTGTGTADIDERKQTLVDFLDDAVAASDKLLDELDAAGVPDVGEGEELAEVFNDGFKAARDALADGLDNAEQLSTDSAADFRDGVTEITDDIDIAFIELQTAFNEAGSELDVDEFDEAYAEEEACEPIRESSA